MNRLLLTLPVAILLSGCGDPAPEANDVAVAPDTTAEAPADPAANAADNAAAAGGPANGGAYRVVDETNPNLPPEAVAALERAKVPPPSMDQPVPERARVRMVTSQGPITIELNGAEAPLHVRSFLHLSQRGFYNGTRFHRFADLMEGSGQPGRIIQGGDPLSRGEETRQFAGIGGPGYNVPRERNQLTHERLVIAAARSQDPDSAGSQFYITQDPVRFLDEGDGYTVFGRVVEGESNALKLRQGDELKNVVVLQGPAQAPAKQ